MNRDRYIAGDWGTSRLRLSLCLGDSVIERREGPGVGSLRGPADETLRPLLADWRAAYGPLPLLLCGMAGSRNGWREVPYLPCPADPRALGEAALRFVSEGAPVAIAPGLSCRSRLGSPDVMRGEETQIAGALALHPGLGAGAHLLCLPGTHTKWAVLEDGRVRDFLTALTGELFALLRGGSTLLRAAGAQIQGGASDSQDGFEQGVEVAAALDDFSLLHGLFGVRSRQLLDGRSPAWALSYLSGLLIGSDVRGAIPLLGAGREAVLIGEGSLNERYAHALRRRGITASCLDGEQCALAGLRTLWQT
ncbi:MAG TPA: 2-dehydro-3-deoxygalactonokinase [Steroidobacteraceae bacterium]|nr:2-dehydro-3-deoxygalactonokinase [Steroidobacteraceae bacterium]